MPFSKKIVSFEDSARKALFCLGLIAAIVAVHQLLMTTWMFLGGVHSMNAPYFWVIGRAWMNGLEPYMDIFEPKPPAIFLLSAVSLLLFQSYAAGFALSIVILWAVPSTLVLSAKEYGKMWMLLGWLYGSMIVLYMAKAAGAWETEYFGAFFGILYVLAAKKFPHFLLLTLLLFFSIGFKEPFFLVLLSSAILLFPEPKIFRDRFLFPFITAAAIGTLLLVLLHIFDGYTGLYLTSIFEHRVFQNSPVWLRGFQFIKIWGHLAGTNVVLPFSIGAIAVCTVRNIPSVIRLFVGFFLTITAVGIASDWQGHHFIFAVPLYAALFLCAAGNIHKYAWESRVVTMLLAITSLTIAYPPSLISVKEANRMIDANALLTSESQANAAVIDSILTACAIDRYFFLQEPSVMLAYTQHSPLNFFPYTLFEHLLRYHPAIKEKSIENLDKAEIVFVYGDAYVPSSSVALEREFGDLMNRYLAQNYTKEAPACARPFLPFHKHHVLFKIDTQVSL